MVAEATDRSGRGLEPEHLRAGLSGAAGKGIEQTEHEDSAKERVQEIEPPAPIMRANKKRQYQ